MACPRLRLGVVIPTLDEECLLPRLLDRLLAVADREDRADAVCVVDGGSGDRTRELARRGGATVVRSRPGRGVQLARGARAVSSDVLLFLHADTLPAAGAIAALRRRFEEGCQVAGMRQRIEAAGWFYRVVEWAANARVRFLGSIYGDSGLCVSRARYLAAGGFRDLSLFEDLDLSRRLGRTGAPEYIRDAELRVSARRWQREGPLRRTLANWLLTSAFLLGMSPDRLVRYYRPERRSS